MDRNQPGGSTTLQAYRGVREMTFRSSKSFRTKLEIRNGVNEVLLCVKYDNKSAKIRVLASVDYPISIKHL